MAREDIMSNSDVYMETMIDLKDTLTKKYTKSALKFKKHILMNMSLFEVSILIDALADYISSKRLKKALSRLYQEVKDKPDFQPKYDNTSEEE